MRRKTGIIIIGNEILSGRTIDTNSNFICKELSVRGFDIIEIATIPDVAESIISKVKEFSSNFEYVFTSGGIGPTHDDITAKSIASAFNLELEQNIEARNLLEKHYSKSELTDARLKMTYIPKGSRLIKNPVSVAPGFIVKNVHVFPGVPTILKAMFFEFIDRLFRKNVLPEKNISTILPEGTIGGFISNIQKEHSMVQIGSYPYFKNNQFGVSLIIKCEDEIYLNKICEKIFNFLIENNGKPRFL